jgi:hypothetical protein
VIKELLGKGLFPSQMPPCFTGERFANFCSKNPVPAIAKELRKNTKAEKYSVARAGHFRRPTVIVNPHQYYFLANEISNNKTTIENFFAQSKISKSIPAFITNQNRSISILATRTLAELKLCTSPGYKYALITDIAQFFPSIYTHSISWALYGKENVKRSLAKPQSTTLPSLGDDLDIFTRHLNSNQTIGLPIGPDSSHILAEIIGVAMDLELQKIFPNLVGFRYVDDYAFYFEKFEEAESCLAAITSVLAGFELNINATKTKIVHVSEVSSDYWTHELKTFSLSNRAKKQKRDILHFFDVSLSIARNNADENVMKFALKKIASKLIFVKNWAIFEANLLRVLLIHPSAIIDVAHILYTYNFYGYPIDKSSIGRTMNAIIKEHAPLGHHSEVAWALWIVAALEIRIPNDVSDEICKMASSPCLLLLLHLNKTGFSRKFDNTILIEKSTVDGPYGDMWLAVYEARVQNFYTPTANPLAGTFFEILEKAGIKFFDFERKPKPLFKLKTKVAPAMWFEVNSESYDEGDVEFEDIPDDYSDGYHEDEDEDEDEEDDEGEDEQETAADLEDEEEVTDDTDNPFD